MLSASSSSSARPPSSPDLLALGWDDRLAADFASRADPEWVPARVAAVERGSLSCLTADGPVRAVPGTALREAAAHDPVAAAGTGDWVAVRRPAYGPEVAELVLARRGVLVRHDAGPASVGQLLASGVDVVAVVEPMDPEPDLGRIERLLVLAWESGAVPVVLLTKADLVTDPDLLVSEAASVAPGAAVIAVSTTAGEGMDDVRELVRPGRTLALVGRSGAGKSSLVNALAGAELLATAEVRRDGKGRHTSTRRQLVVLPGGGVVIDTPGLRGVGLTAVDDGLAAAFDDVESLASDCRFRDCAHDAEPGCAIAEARADGRIDEARYARWVKLRREAAWVAMRGDARARAEARKEWARRTREGRARSRP